MESIKIIRVLSELKKELMMEAEIDKKPEEVRLYFSFYDDTLTVHDYYDHESAVDVAVIIEEEGVQSVEMHCETQFFEIIDFLLKEKCELKIISKKLNQLVEQYGYYN